MKLRELQERMADSTRAPFGRVRTVAAALRAQGLISSGPRGPGAPEMAPTDIANLLLALMYDSDITESCACVPQLRATVVRSCDNPAARDEEEFYPGLPELPYFEPRADGQIYLGDVLDKALEHLATFGTFDTEVLQEGSQIQTFTLQVTAPIKWAKIDIDTEDVFREIRFGPPIERDIADGTYEDPFLRNEERKSVGILSSRWIYLDDLLPLMSASAHPTKEGAR